MREGAVREDATFQGVLRSGVQWMRVISKFSPREALDESEKTLELDMRAIDQFMDTIKQEILKRLALIPFRTGHQAWVGGEQRSTPEQKKRGHAASKKSGDGSKGGITYGGNGSSESDMPGWAGAASLLGASVLVLAVPVVRRALAKGSVDAGRQYASSARERHRKGETERLSDSAFKSPLSAEVSHAARAEEESPQATPRQSQGAHKELIVRVNRVHLQANAEKGRVLPDGSRARVRIDLKLPESVAGKLGKQVARSKTRKVVNGYLEVNSGHRFAVPTGAHKSGDLQVRLLGEGEKHATAKCGIYLKSILSHAPFIHTFEVFDRESWLVVGLMELECFLENGPASP